MTDAEHLRWAIEALEGIRKRLRSLPPSATKSELQAWCAAGLVGYRPSKRRKRPDVIDGQALELPPPALLEESRPRYAVVAYQNLTGMPLRCRCFKRWRPRWESNPRPCLASNELLFPSELRGHHQGQGNFTSWPFCYPTRSGAPCKYGPKNHRASAVIDSVVWPRYNLIHVSEGRGALLPGDGG